MSISGDAQKATANPADLQAQITLLEQQLTDLKKSVLLVSAPEGDSADQRGSICRSQPGIT